MNVDSLELSLRFFTEMMYILDELTEEAAINSSLCMRSSEESAVRFVNGNYGASRLLLF